MLKQSLQPRPWQTDFSNPTEKPLRVSAPVKTIRGGGGNGPTLTGWHVSPRRKRAREVAPPLSSGACEGCFLLALRMRCWTPSLFEPNRGERHDLASNR